MTSEERAEAFKTLLTESFGVTEFPADAPPLVALDKHHELARVLKEEHGYVMYINVIGSHWEEKKAKKEGDSDIPAHYEVAQGLRTTGAGTHEAWWRVEVPMDGACESLYDLYAGADWMEREQYDLVGVKFANHPDLRRIMMPEDWEGHPLHKDYAIETGCSPWR